MNIRHTHSVVALKAVVARKAVVTLAAIVALGACGSGTTGTESAGSDATIIATAPARDVSSEVATPVSATTVPTAAETTQAEVTSTVPPQSVVTSPRPQALDSLPTVTLLAPGSVADDAAPEFSWAPVDEAVTYRLAVLAPDHPLWSWTGSQTHVTLGLVSADRSPLAAGLALELDSTWSVAALDADGTVIALSPRQHVSPPPAG